MTDLATATTTTPTGTPNPAVSGDTGAPQVTAQPAEDRVARQRAEREAAYWRGIAEGTVQGGAHTGTPQSQSQSHSQSQPAVPNDDLGPEPQFADFASPEDYEKVKTAWVTKKATIDARRTFRAELDAEREQERLANTKQRFDTQMAEAATTDPDIYMLARELGNRVTGPVADLIIDSSNAPALIRHLHTNPVLATKLNRMTPTQIAREIGRMEMELGKTDPAPTQGATNPAPNPTPNTPTPASTVKTTTTAPEPIPTVQPGAAPTNWDDDRTDTQNWIAQRNEQTRRR